MPVYENGKSYFNGVVLEKREQNFYDDSDFYVVYWDEKDGKIKRYTYDTTRFQMPGTAEVDATEEVKQKAEKHLVDVYVDMITKDEEERAKFVEVGKEVEVIKGRKVPIGTVGTVFWMRTDKYCGNTVTKIGIKGDKGEVYWTYFQNVRVRNPMVLMSKEQIRELAEKTAKKRNWAMHLVPRRMAYL